MLSGQWGPHWEGPAPRILGYLQWAAAVFHCAPHLGVQLGESAWESHGQGHSKGCSPEGTLLSLSAGWPSLRHSLRAPCSGPLTFVYLEDCVCHGRDHTLVL